MADNYRQMVKGRVFDEDTFVQMTMKGKLNGDLPWQKVVVRPVLIKNRRHLQFSHFTAKQDITKNYAGGEAEAHLDELLALPFHNILVRSTGEDLNVQITPKGKAIIQRGQPNETRQPQLTHDANKDLPIPADKPDAFLQTIGIMSVDGRVKANMQGKFSQLNEFLKLLEHTGTLESFEHSPLNILDCGCGSSYLTFAMYHYLNNLRGIPAELTGIDVNAKLIDKSNAHSQELGLGDACFYTSSIADYVPEAAPDIVIALHACDTATDDALALGIRQGAGLILAAPCCHHHMHQQLQTVEPFQPVLRHGILKQRMADILTDTFRALILRIMGYKTDVIQFVASEHTDRNLMIRAVRRTNPGASEFVQEYVALKAFWGVTPYLETMLGENFTQFYPTPNPSP
jgi:SAM-dependent methyltransferase